MADEAAPSSIAARIAALNLNQVNRNQPGSAPPSYEQATAKKRPPPPLPKRPQPEARSQTTNNPPLQSSAPASQRTIGNQPSGINGKELAPPPVTRFTDRDAPARPELPQRPALPPRASQESGMAPPSLPPRKGSTQSLTRRDSQESIASTMSARSTFSVRSNGTSHSARTSLSDTNPARSVKAPAYDPNTLPPLPEKRVKEEPVKTRAALKSVHSFPAAVPRVNGALPERQARGIAEPPALPSRPSLPPRQNSIEPAPARKLPPRSALSFGMNKSTEAPPPLPAARPGGDAPPPIPRSSRPDLAALQASKPKPGAMSDSSLCLQCRDFSTVDAHAARFPRQSVPSLDTNWLAHQLCSPFPSHTDKARALFTWLHHNIEYDVKAFFSNNLKASTPNSTLASGLAVCEGYAGLFVALALAAGLEAVVVGGHGKGYSYSQPGPGQPLPRFNGNHAWSACKIDNGEWKLLDACWGAGHVSGANQPYTKQFNPSMFTMDNAEFGLRHFPEDASKWFGPVLTWEQYLLCDGVEESVKTYSGLEEHGIKKPSFQPQAKLVRRDPNLGPTVRFSFNKVCQHWTTEKAGFGQPYLLVLVYGGDQNEKKVPLNQDGFFWWLDVDRNALGPSGSPVKVLSISQFSGNDGKGLTAQEFTAKIGRCGWGANGLAEWTVG